MYGYEMMEHWQEKWEKKTYSEKEERQLEDDLTINVFVWLK